jgi:hypothetical protein
MKPKKVGLKPGFSWLFDELMGECTLLFYVFFFKYISYREILSKYTRKNNIQKRKGDIMELYQG